MQYHKFLTRRTALDGRSSFTLIELLVVIAIISVLAVVVLLTLNPAELLKQSRDSNRLSDLETINKALSIFQVDVTSGSLGVASTTYVSIPDPAATSTAGTNCSGLGLSTSTLPTGWSYHCSASSTYAKVDGTGWIPVNFDSISTGSPLSKLPTDPTNSTSSSLYYTYTPGGSWELTSAMESSKYRLGGSNDKTSTDGGSALGLYEVGSDLNLTPVDYGYPSLVSWLKLDESGTTNSDGSGQGNDGSMLAGATYPTSATTPTDFHSTSGCKSGDCASFDGSSDCISVPDAASLDFGTGSFTVSMWIKTSSQSNDATLAEKSSGSYGTTGTGYFIFAGSLGGVYARVRDVNGNHLYTSANAANPIDGNWHNIVFVFSRSRGDIYVDGVNKNSSTDQNTLTGSINNSDVMNFGRGSLSGSACASERILNGKMDDIRIYNQALSAAEVAALYNSTK